MIYFINAILPTNFTSFHCFPLFSGTTLNPNCQINDYFNKDVQFYQSEKQNASNLNKLSPQIASQENQICDDNFISNNVFHVRNVQNQKQNCDIFKESSQNIDMSSSIQERKSIGKHKLKRRGSKKQKNKTKLIDKKGGPETKNLIKNYGRAILTFIIKNNGLRKKVLKHLEILDSQFLETVYSFRNYIHTISAIRYLWQSHPFSTAYRILSCEYLRKHSLQHVFNSRVFKHGVYLKYQKKLINSLERPQQFQSIKLQ